MSKLTKTTGFVFCKSGDDEEKMGKMLEWI